MPATCDSWENQPGNRIRSPPPYNDSFNTLWICIVFEESRRESLGVPVEGEEKETMCLLSFNKNNSEMYLSKTHGLRSFFFLVQAWCAACSPSSPHSLIAQRLLYWAHFTTEGRKKSLNVWKSDWQGLFFPWTFKCFQKRCLVALDNATDPFTSHCTHWRVKLYTQLKWSFLARFRQLLF